MIALAISNTLVGGGLLLCCRPLLLLDHDDEVEFNIRASTPTDGYNGAAAPIVVVNY